MFIGLVCVIAIETMVAVLTINLTPPSLFSQRFNPYPANIFILKMSTFNICYILLKCIPVIMEVNSMNLDQTAP